MRSFKLGNGRYSWIAFLFQILLVTFPLHSYINLPIYFFRSKRFVLLQLVTFLTLVFLYIYIFEGLDDLNRTSFGLALIYFCMYSYVLYYLLYLRDFFFLDVKAIYNFLLFFILIHHAIWLIDANLLSNLYGQEFSYRFAGWAREPSYFAEVVYLFLIISVLIQPIYYFIAALVVCGAFYVSSVSQTILLYFFITAATYFTIYIIHRIRLSQFFTCSLLLIQNIFLCYFMSDISIEKGSWRSISNWLSFISSPYVSLPTTLEFGDVMISRIEELNLGYIESIWSIFFFNSYYFGYLISMIVIVLVLSFLLKLTTLLDKKTNNILTQSLVLSGYMIALFHSPKWLIICAFPAIFFKSFVGSSSYLRHHCATK